MSQLSNMNNPIIEKIKQSELNFKSISIGGQAPLGDWFEVVTERLIYVSANTLTIQSGLAASTFFSVSDKIRWSENGGAYKYGYIYEVAGANIKIISGSEYTLTNALITTFSVALKEGASGHPDMLRYALNATAETGAYSNLYPYEVDKGYFKLRGRSMYTTISINNGVIVGGPTALFIDLPLPVNTFVETAQKPTLTIDNFGVKFGVYIQSNPNKLKVWADIGLNGFATTLGGLGVYIDGWFTF